MQAADDVDLADLSGDRFEDLFFGELVGVRIAWLGGEVAEASGEPAEVRRVHLPVQHVAHGLAVTRALHLVRQRGKPVEIRGAEARDAVFEVEPLPVEQATADRLERRIPQRDPLERAGVGLDSSGGRHRLH